jgi:WhiB family redox-sensing transcriptional regulator
MTIQRRDVGAIVSAAGEARLDVASLPQPPAWTEQALCAQIDLEAFFPEKGGSTRAAKRICAECPVKTPCLRYALDHAERFGIWGGVTERERRRMLKDQAS